MSTIPHAPHGVPVSTRDGWRTFEHRALTRRTAGARALRSRRMTADRLHRDAIETWHRRPRAVRFLARLATVLLTALAAADVFADTPPLRMAALVGAVVVAGAASLLAIAASEPVALEPTDAHRWQLQAVASAVVMFMLMANGTDGAPGDLLWFLIVVGAASTLVAM